MIRCLDLFSGIGGFALGLSTAGSFETVAFCEIDPYCRAVLRKHWPGVPIFGDVRDVTSATVEPLGRIDLICGGPPCQPISCAGKRRGEADDRWLWPEALRIVREVRPRWILFENPTGIRTLGVDAILAELEALGYACRPLVVGAKAVGAPHGGRSLNDGRMRVWIVGLLADADKTGRSAEWGGGLLDGQRTAPWHDPDGCDRAGLGDAAPRERGIRPRPWQESGEDRGPGPRGLGNASLVAEREPDNAPHAFSGQRPWGVPGSAGDGGMADSCGSGPEGRLGEPGNDGAQRSAAQRDGDVRLPDPEERGEDRGKAARVPHVNDRCYYWPAPRGAAPHGWEPSRTTSLEEVAQAEALPSLDADAHGVPVDVARWGRRIRRLEAVVKARHSAVGNAVIPQIVEAIGRAIAACAVLLMICCPVAHGGAHPALDPGTLARISAAWPEISAAADLAEVEPAVLAALLVHETRVRPVAARGHRGYGQMALRWWRAWLAAEGWHVEDLDDAAWGLWIVGAALGWVRWRYSVQTTAGLLCAWGVGPRAEGWPRGCPYSRAVLGVAGAIGGEVHP